MSNQNNNGTGFTQVINNLRALQHLPPTSEYPGGMKLIPGSNNVPNDYLKAIQNFEVPFIREDGKQGKRKILEDLAIPHRYSEGRPPVEVRGAISKDAEQGPPAPFDLTGYSDELALKLIEVTSDKEALKRWSKDTRSDVASAAKAKAR